MNGLTVEFYRTEASSGKNILFKHDGLKGMMEGKDYHAVE